MNLSQLSPQLIQPFHVAGMLWGNLEKFAGIHWQCGAGEQAANVKWYCYDRDLHRTPPALNRRFTRGLFADEDNRFFYPERLSNLKMLYFYMGGGSQTVVAMSTQFIKTESIIDLVTEAGFKNVKRIQDGCVLTFKY
jgi:hypothetical protein